MTASSSRNSWFFRTFPRPGHVFTQPLLSFWAFSAVLLIAGGVDTPVQAQGDPRVVTLKDGTQFEGFAGSTDELSNAEESAQTFDARPITRVDDGLRRIYFNRSKMVLNTGESFRREASITVWQRASSSGRFGAGYLISAGPFNSNGHRTLTTMETDGKTGSVVQVITELNPRYAKLQTAIGGEGVDKRWDMRIATGTIPLDVLNSLLRDRITNIDDPSEYLANIEFYGQAKMYREAIEETRFAKSKFPDLAKRLDDNLAVLMQEYGRQILGEVQLRMQFGQFQLATALAQVINKDGLATRINLDFQQEIATVQKGIDDARTLLAQIEADVALQKQAGGTPDEAALLDGFVAELQTGLNSDSARRLASYQLRAADEQFTLQQRLALAISGWIVGSANAIENYATAQSLITVRNMTREYLGNADGTRREQILAELAAMEGSEPNLLAPLIALMGPVNPPDLDAYNGSEPIRFSISIPGTPSNGNKPEVFECLAHLPPGYNHSREYPMMLTLRGNNTSQEMLTYWCGNFNQNLGVNQGQAMRYGFVVVSVDWARAGQSKYGYSAREHATIAAALRESLRKFSVDSDRVILSGIGMGAEAAYDMGVSHPDLFSGVVSISGGMDKHTVFYRDNIYPPMSFYCVAGQRDVETVPRSLVVWNEWLKANTRYNRCIVVLYNGRLNEIFPEEQSAIFQWALLQNRYWPGRADDFELDFDSLRPWDNRFWFYEVNGFPEDRMMLVEDWRDNNRPKPFTITAKRKAGQTNSFTLGPSLGLGNRATFWLSPQFVDFDQKVEIGGRGSFKDFVQPSRRVMLEDVRTRADRKHPFWARLVEDGSNWQVRDQ